MDYFIFTGSAFFQYISRENGMCDYLALYHEFSKAVFNQCTADKDHKELLLTLIYTEIELQSLYEHRLPHDAGERREYAHKALLLVRQTLELLQKQTPPANTTPDTGKEGKTPVPTLRWTSSAVDLVEVIYGFEEMKCINNGDVAIGELATFFYELLGVEAKACYRFYTDIKHRKNDSRTYFLDKMQERLNERMRRDDEKEMQRR